MTTHPSGAQRDWAPDRTAADGNPLAIGTGVVVNPAAGLAGLDASSLVRVARLRADGNVDVTDGDRTWLNVAPHDLIVPNP